MKQALQVFIAALFFPVQFLNSQCASNSTLGTSSNMFTQIRNSTNPVVADKNLNTIVFIHRNNAGAHGGNSGHLRYDVSVNAGTSWLNDQGVLNPNNTSLARYPNVTIHNPTNNINPANAYLSYMAATINSVNSTWNGVVSGVRQLNGAGNTENYNQPVIAPQLIPHSIVKGAPGIYWAIDALFNGSIITGFAVYKGSWNALTNDIVWSTNYTVSPNFSTAGVVGDYNIAFDPSGTIGWFSFLSRVSPGPSNNSYYPVFYKTTNGGGSWTGPIQVDLDNFNCITSNITSPNVASTNFEHDLVVDLYGNPHLFTTICTGNNGNSVFYGSWHKMFDITLKYGVWAAYDVANVLAGRGTWGVSPNVASMDMAPQAARSADGSKVFFTWTDNTSYVLGSANLSPNLFGKAFDVVQNKWTPVKDFTSCNAGTNGLIIFPHIAPEVLEPSPNNFKIAPVYGEYTIGNDPLQISNFKFLDNVLFSTSEFSVNNPFASVSITPPGPLLLCPGTNVSIGLSGTFGQILWSTGSTNQAISVTTGTNTFYTVSAQQNCYAGSDTIFVSNQSFTTSSAQQSFCKGDSTQLSVSGNAFSYTWNPGAQNGSLITVQPTTSLVYTLTASGSSCSSTQTLAINVFSLPVLTISGKDSICAGSSVTHTVSGASVYSWSHGAFGNVVTTTPVTNTVYTVVGTDTNLCASSQTISIVLMALPSVSISSTRAVICKNESAILTALGASTYSWINLSTISPSILVTPSVTSQYSVIGSNTFGCSNSVVFTVSVSLCTGISGISENQEYFQVYPNPNSGDFAVQIPETGQLILYNELGVLLREDKAETGKEHQLEYTNLPSGVYFLVYKSSEGLRTKKVVVSR